MGEVKYLVAKSSEISPCR